MRSQRTSFQSLQAHREHWGPDKTHRILFLQCVRPAVAPDLRGWPALQESGTVLNDATCKRLAAIKKRGYIKKMYSANTYKIWGRCFARHRCIPLIPARSVLPKHFILFSCTLLIHTHSIHWRTWIDQSIFRNLISTRITTVHDCIEKKGVWCAKMSNSMFAKCVHVGVLLRCKMDCLAYIMNRLHW